MRILQLHNAYRHRGGEERALEIQAAILRAAGHEVLRLERESASASRGEAARGLLRGGLGAQDVAATVVREGIEVVHAHNLQPLLGPRALAAAREAGAATVVHLHNYRTVCAIGVAFLGDRPCARCHGRATWPGVVHRCRGSLAEGAAYAAGLAAHQRALIDAADALVAVSDAHARALEQRVALPAGRVHVVPNPIEVAADAGPAPGDGGHALFVGRLVAEKGAAQAIAAARRAGVPLVIAGDGPERARLERLAAGAARFTGEVGPDELASLRSGAVAALIPSRWEEPCPYAALEALAAGVPVLASDLGGLPEIVGPEQALPYDDPDVWAERIGELARDPDRRERTAREGLERVRGRFSPDAFRGAIEAVYARAIEEHRRRT